MKTIELDACSASFNSALFGSWPVNIGFYSIDFKPSEQEKLLEYLLSEYDGLPHHAHQSECRIRLSHIYRYCGRTSAEFWQARRGVSCGEKGLES